MARRLKIVVAYDGTPFAGWQSQTHHNTIQDHLEKAVHRISGERARVHAAGRTDAGVHALAQCAHFDVQRRRLEAVRWTAALNALLPPTIRVLRSAYVSDKFHARYSAREKSYRYRIWSGPVLPPLEYNRAWHVTSPLDFERLQQAAQIFAGRHDFAGFAANRGKSSRQKTTDDPTTKTVRTIRLVKVQRKGDCVRIEFTGDGFLYKMVRLMTGAIVECASGRSNVQEISDRLASARANSARFAAPPEGLFLVRVRY